MSFSFGSSFGAPSTQSGFGSFGQPQQQQQRPQQNPNNDTLVANSPNDTVSSVVWSPRSNLLAASSWNKSVVLYDVQQNGQAIQKATFQMKQPVLDCCFSSDGMRVFGVGCDNSGMMFDLTTSQSQQVAAHQAPIKTCHFTENNLLVTGSWDKTLRYWDCRQQNPALKVDLPERVYAVDVTGKLVVAALANRHLLIYNLGQPQQPFRNYQSPLKMQSRCIANFKDLSGFALGSIEGRVAVQHVEEKSRKNFAFKCHRHNDDVYAVNSISFHPLGTFATCGSDGSYTFWDKDSKQRLKMFNRMDNPITASAFNAQGNIFAYAVGYDWSKGAQHWDKTKTNGIFLHAVQNQEISPRNR